jgi:secreted PhoX family phosphatase
MALSRRAFLHHTAVAGGLTIAGPLEAVLARLAAENVAGRPSAAGDFRSGDQLRQGRRRRNDDARVRHRAWRLDRRPREPRRHDPQLRRRRDALGQLADPRGIAPRASSGPRARLRNGWQGPTRTPDNIAVSPRGGLVLCEDGGGITRVHGLTTDGGIFPFARNNALIEPGCGRRAGGFRESEFAGATFSPDGRWLFLNIQNPGITFAITGPWKQELI